MFRFLFLPLSQCLLPWAVYLALLPGSAAVQTISPWTVVATLLAADLLIVVVGWKRLASNRRARQAEAFILLLSAFVPLATYRFLLADLPEPLSLAEQIVFYSLDQLIVYGGFAWGQELYGRIGERRYSEKVLSGEIKFESRKEFLAEREKRMAEKGKR